MSDPLLDGPADLLDCLRIGLGTLQEAAVASQDLVQGVPRQVEEALRRVHDGIVGKAGIRDDEVLLGGLEGLDEGEVRIVEDLAGVRGGTSDEAPGGRGSGQVLLA